MTAPLSGADAAIARFRLRWWAAIGVIPPGAPPSWQPVIDEIVAEGRAGRGLDGELTPRTHPLCRQYTDEAAAAITRAIRMVLTALEAEGEVPAATWHGRGAARGINREHVDIAGSWLRADGLIVTRGGITRPAQPLTWVKPKPAPAAALDFDEPEPAPAPAAAQAVQRLDPTLAPAPKSAPPRPAPAPPAPVMSGPHELLARTAYATEVLAGLVAAPQRVRTPLGASPLLDTQLRLCVVFAASARPLTVHEITTQLTKTQIAFLRQGLADGVRRGAFTVSGVLGRYGARYALADPAVFDASWESVNAHAADLRRRRDARTLQP